MKEIKEYILKLENILKETEVKLKELKAHQTKCCICGSKKEITKHHIKPLKKYPKNKEVIYICRNCHNILESFKFIISVLKQKKKLSITNFKQMNKSIKSW